MDQQTKKAYDAPVLKSLGALTTITQAGSMMTPEGVNMMGMFVGMMART